MPGTFTRDQIRTPPTTPAAPPGIQKTGDQTPVFSCVNARRPPAPFYGPFLFPGINTRQGQKKPGERCQCRQNITICDIIAAARVIFRRFRDTPGCVVTTGLGVSLRFLCENLFFFVRVRFSVRRVYENNFQKS